MTTTEIAELRRSIGQLRQCLGTLRSRYGDDAPAVRRLVNDVERLDIDADELEGAPPVPEQQTAEPSPVGKIMLDDTPYDESLWEGADDEGVGGYRGDRR